MLCTALNEYLRLSNRYRVVFVTLKRLILVPKHFWLGRLFSYAMPRRRSSVACALFAAALGGLFIVFMNMRRWELGGMLSLRSAGSGRFEDSDRYFLLNRASYALPSMTTTADPPSRQRASYECKNIWTDEECSSRPDDYCKMDDETQRFCAKRCQSCSRGK